MKLPYHTNQMCDIPINADSFRKLKIKYAGIKPVQKLILFLFFILINNCVTEFIPAVSEEKELLVVEGLITDQPEINIIKLSKSMPFGKKGDARPLNGCSVSISDNLGNNYSLKEAGAGTYVTDSVIFKGVVGRFYTLHISINDGYRILNYDSYPEEMKPVPPIDSLYYEKTVITEKTANYPAINGCQIYLDTHDSENNCKFFRWDYSETWVLRLLFPVENMKCWISYESQTINIKSTATIEESSINRYPINYISNSTDRLKTQYSILVNQYSINEDEYIFWEKLQNLTQQVGGLYDIIPFSIPSNLQCVENPNELILGYFSVSAKSSKRIFIKDSFSGIIDPYANCISDTLQTDYVDNIPGLNTSFWVLLIHQGSFTSPAYTVITNTRGCADCTVRGTNREPDFWKDGK